MNSTTMNIGVCAHQAPLSMGFPTHEYWSKVLFPTPGDFPDPGMEPASPDSLLLCHLGSPVVSVVVCTCQSSSPGSSHPLFPAGIHILVLYICGSVSRAGEGLTQRESQGR